jgi:hypothetical protein
MRNATFEMADELIEQRLMLALSRNLVIRFDHTRQRERAMGVDHWNFPDFGILVSICIWEAGAQQPCGQI